FEHARAGDSRGDPRSLDLFNGRAEAVEIQVVKRNAGRAQFEGGFQLFRSADQKVQLWRTGGDCRWRRSDQVRHVNLANRLSRLERLELIDGITPNLIQERCWCERRAFGFE